MSRIISRVRPDFGFKLIGIDEEQAWNDSLRGLRFAFNHTIEANRAFAQSTGHEVRLLVCRTANATAACPLAFREYAGRTDVFTTPGFAGFASQGTMTCFEDFWQDVGRECDWVCAYVQQHPVLKSPFVPAAGQNHGRVAYVLDLSLSMHELLGRMSQSRRRQLLRPLASGVEIVVSKVGAATFLQREAPAFYAQRGASELMQPSEKGWEILVSSPHTLAVQVRVNGATHAVSLFGTVTGVADYLYNVSTNDGQPFSANLIWSALPELQCQGARSLNLGGGIQASDAIAEFKRRFGPDEWAIPTFNFIFDSDAYDDLSAAASAPRDGSFFPAYHFRGRK